ncbi:MAG: signal peptide peptidase SppA, partial [Candidatus Eisenbacteria bacterium]|nr:signal peptide peptidase SppA [Candidatus Eisenbacteria bacterium]
ALFIALGAVLLNVAERVRRPLHTTIAPRVLLFDVPYSVDEGPAPPSMSLDVFRKERPTFHDLLFAVYNAAEDRSVDAIVLHLEGVDWGWARVSEMAAALRAFQASGKRVYASLDGGGEKEYVLASVADQLAMPPVSTLQLDGLSASAMFMMGAYDKLGIKPNFAHVGRFKSAVETYTRDSLSPDARAAMESLLDDTYGLLVDSIAVARQIPADSVRSLIDGGPYTAREALQLGLLDTLLAEADLDSMATHASGDRLGTGSMLRYAQEGGGGTGEHIALLVAEGEIISGKSRDNPFGGRAVGDETLVEALRDIRSRKNIRAVVLRIDSPGGSGDASDAVWQEIRRVRREKPVIVSMGDVAASGGYYLACAGDAIVADPGTITGSIGVFGGKLNMLGLYRKLGLNVETITRGKHAAMLSPFTDFSPEELERYQKSLEQFYGVFLARVAEGRGMDPAVIDSVGQGRVWSGIAARQRGLVDTLGGLETAFDMARTRAKIDDDADIVVDVYPRPRRTFVQQWLGNLFEDGDSDEAIVPAMRDLATWYRASSLSRGAAQARMPFTITIQ